MVWAPFNWGSRGAWFATPEEGIYVAHEFIPNGIRVVLEGTDATAQHMLHVFNLRGPNAAPDYADCLAAAQAVATWWDTQYRNMVTTSIYGRRVVATGLNTVPAAQATVLLTTQGTRGTTPPPASVSCALKWYTHSSGRRHFGRFFSWPMDRPDIAGDIFSPAYMGAIIGVCNNLLLALNTAGYPLCIFSRTDIALYNVSGVIAIDAVVDSRRRRLTGRGSI